MATLTIRDLDESVKSALQEKAATNGRSIEAEARMAIYAHVGARQKRDLAATKAVVPPEPENHDWFAIDEDELRVWDGD